MLTSCDTGVQEDTFSIYILLIRGNTIVSKLIRLFSHAEYTHASLGKNIQCKEFYSFSRKYTNLPLPAGLVEENIDKGVFKKSGDAPCALYEVKVTRETYENVISELDEMWDNRSKFHYSLVGPILCRANIALETRTRFFCSQFVAHLLSKNDVICLKKSASLYHPIDFVNQEELQLRFKGTLSGLSKAFAQSQNV